ncbi:unnamed protein product [Candida verbasci]|uniref:WW domain-containing protein n=1 Tax=Candida verbasci TaxID=1227364 RepID=A0A9W4XFD0_9ASCO|nr:unnamed protein product [Candida verbasci]
MPICPKSSNTNNKWKLEYDTTLNQYYYVNLLDNSISFDSPCEVNHRKRNIFGIKTNSTCSFFEKPFLVRKISSKLSLKKSRSNNSTYSTNSTNSSSSRYNIEEFEEEDESKSINSIISGIDDEYYLYNNEINKFRNFAGTTNVNNITNLDPIETPVFNSLISTVSDTSVREVTRVYESDTESTVSDFDSELDYKIKDFDHAYIYSSDNNNDGFEMIEVDGTYDKEIELRELRLQMLQELC